jgi:hypothetical protein
MLYHLGGIGFDGQYLKLNEGSVIGFISGFH